MKVIPINNGYYQIKSVNQEICKSRIRESIYGAIATTNETLELNNKLYIIGDGSVNKDYDKTLNENTKLLILNMLSRFTKDKETFKIGLTAPPISYVQQREELPKYLIGDYKIKSNGIEKEISIKEVEVYPETFIIPFNYNPSLYENKILYVIDIGGLTTNICRLVDGDFNDNDYISMRAGMYNIDLQISSMLNHEYIKQNLNVQPEDLEIYRKSGLSVSDIKGNILDLQKDKINAIYLNHIKDIIDRCDSKGWNIKIDNVFITGGGGSIIFNTIHDILANATLSSNPLFDNLEAVKAICTNEGEDNEGRA